MITRRPKNLPITESISGTEYIEVWQDRPKKTLVANLMGGTGGYDGNPNTIIQDATHRFATDAEKTTWNGKEPGNSNIQAHIGSSSNPHGVTKAQVGLSNVDNTNDAGKPISTATQTALDGKSSTSHNHDGSYAAIGHNHSGVYEPANTNIQTHISSSSNPHSVTKAQVGLGNVDNTSDTAKPISTATQTALDGKSATSHNHDGAYSAIGHNHSGVYEPANSNIQAHVASTHAPSNAQKNSDITLGEIEAKLIGVISSHSHAGAAVDVKQTEVDFGTVPVKMKRFTVTDAAVSPSNQIMVNVSYDDPSDGDTDSAEWFEGLSVMAKAGTGQFFLYCNSLYNDLNGKVKINFIIG